VRSILCTVTAVIGVVSLGTAAADPPPALIELRRHLVDGDINTLTFRSIDQMFDTRRVASAAPVWALAEAPTKLDFAYQFEGKTIPAAEFAERTFTNALIILRNDRIVYENYFNNTGPDTHFLSMSMAKSITSTLIGMAVDDKLIGSVDDPIVKYVPELEGSGYDGVTIRQALMMRSGVDWSERYDFGKETPMSRLHNAAIVENRIRFTEPALTIKRAHPPGEVFNYSTVETGVLGWVLARAVKRPLEDYMADRWWKRAGMQSHSFWIADGPPGVGRAVNGMGFNAVLRDYARFGLMILHEGKANGQQLVSSAWVREATRPRGTEPIAPGSTRGYQYQWWTFTDSQAFAAMGLQGQFTYIDPATNTVVVKVSYFPPGEQRADAESEAFFRAVSKWTPTR
jgi:CubicO group peptidase (beta-lactamase class C family)